MNKTFFSSAAWWSGEYDQLVSTVLSWSSVFSQGYNRMAKVGFEPKPCCRCRRRLTGVNTSPNNDDNMVSVQNLLSPFCCVLGKKHFTTLFLDWWPLQEVLNFIHISIKLKAKITNFNRTAIFRHLWKRSR